MTAFCACGAARNLATAAAFLRCSCRPIKSRKVAQRLNSLLKNPKEQIPRRLNFTPTSAKAALVGGPGSPARDDKNTGLGRGAEAPHYPNDGSNRVFQQAVKPK